MAFLLDTNICIFLMKGIPLVSERTKAHAKDAMLISEVSLAELKYGVAKSERHAENSLALDRFQAGVQVLPIRDVLDVFAAEKARLAKIGSMIADFDLLIGATAIYHNVTLVTNNTKHFERLHGIDLAD
ncbi:MAG: PIN domain-containing protein [Flavobacteriales bacterium]|nr:PIN domain-containing protein [Flavobacteriales bacterium]MCC6938653.1 PIN domain-containing protein [Flavobacteriales bacterium]